VQCSAALYELYAVQSRAGRPQDSPCCRRYCTALHCTALHCTALHCTALHCSVCTATKLENIALRYVQQIVQGARYTQSLEGDTVWCFLFSVCGAAHHLIHTACYKKLGRQFASCADFKPAAHTTLVSSAAPPVCTTVLHCMHYRVLHGPGNGRSGYPPHSCFPSSAPGQEPTNQQPCKPVPTGADQPAAL
jgi:hypothetical protein